MNEETIITIHNEILNKFLEYKSQYPEFTFSTRVTNRYNRLERGYWFLGSDYIFVPLYKVFDANNHTQTIGFVVVDDGQYIEIVFREISDIQEHELDFYNDLIEYLRNIDFVQENMRQERKYFFRFNQNNWQENLDFYVNDFRKKTLELLEKYDLSERYIIDDELFNVNMNRISNYKNNLDNEQNINIENLEMDQTMITKNIILYGSPGVGKTYSHKKLIALIEGNDFKENKIFDFIINNKDDEIEVGSVEELFEKVKSEQRMKFITFHQSFGYEDFIEGFRPNENGNIELQDGIFKIICNDANNDRNNNYYLVIDEINRGNISKIFGELITLIEEDKRDTLEVTLPYSKKLFKIPSNLYIIGTMNSTDKSIALIDIALRRRFTFLKMEPNLELVDNDKAKNIMKQLNEKITETLGADYILGHSYFMKIENDDDLEFVLEYKIKPLLEEYYYGDSKGLNQILEIINV